MKNIRLYVILIDLSLIFVFSGSSYLPEWSSLDTRPLPSWYDQSKVGIFIHWGVFSVPSINSEACTGGNILINVGPTSYGKIAPIFEERLRQMGSWLKVNGEAIYSSIPWKYQNDTINTNVWYTSSKDKQYVYASLLVWPNDTAEITLGAPVSSGSTRVTLLGSDVGPLKWRSAGASGGIIIDVSNIKIYSLASDWAWVFKLENITPKRIHMKLEKHKLQ
ncbi:unnamed protein product [Rotaria sp. Silwood1]|nr:unnamed protein product [Rotaria sp. Silwood1]CAF1099126.1 unnamed protein product [Rotaria sp. Silwood1]